MNQKLCLAVLICIEAYARGATLFVPVSADTTIFELNPTFNLGAELLGAGAINLPAFDTGLPARMRALMKFDFSHAPTNGFVTAAQLNITVLRVPPLPSTGSTFELHRLLKDWGEGTGSGLRGIDANPGEATWMSRMSEVSDWGAPGASDASDAIQGVSSSVVMDGLDTYAFPTTSALVADVQQWILKPDTNFGWLMKSTAESLNESARRFANKESGDQAPALIITYVIPGPQPRIEQFELRSTGMFLSWIGGVAPYQIQRAENVLGPWTAVLASTDLTQATVPAELENAFYRVVSTTP